MDVEIELGVAPDGVLSRTPSHRTPEAVDVSAALMVNRATDRKHDKPLVLCGFCLLVVDYNAIDRAVAKRILTGAGAEVLACSDGQQAAHAIRDAPKRLNVVLLPVQMPVLDGYAATRAIREDLGLKSLPVIALSAAVSVEERTRDMDAAMDGFGSNPSRQTPSWKRLPSLRA